ncbi:MULTISPECIES: hypothetical protein [Gammaproteobacteria]|uniref:hypothetical protein n=1 Tax=Gammaproteobacteria TaxID=1236 RepID=UPI002FCC6C06
MKVKCNHCLESSDKKVITPFKKGGLYEAVPLVINGKQIPNEWEIKVAEREHKHGTGWVAITRWPSGLVILGIAGFEEVSE